MNILIILGHPDSGSFNHALAEAGKTQLINNGHSVVFHDLYKEQFNAVQYSLSNADNEDINTHCSDLVNCDGIIIIHPNWWGQPPAIVKGYLERVFLPEVAYTFEKDANNSLIIKGLLKAKIAIILNTSNTPEELEEKIYKDPLETIWKNRVFKSCGISNYKRLNFSVIKDSSYNQRTAWLAETRQLINNCFPKE